MQSARCAAGNSKVSQLLPTRASQSPSATTPFVPAVHASVTLPSNGDTNDTANRSSFQWQRFKIDFPIRYGKFGLFDAIEHIFVSIVFTIDSYFTFQRLIKVTFDYISSITSEFHVHSAVEHRSKDDVRDRSKAVHKRRAHQDIPSAEGGLSGTEQNYFEQFATGNANQWMW